MCFVFQLAVLRKVLNELRTLWVSIESGNA